MSIRLIAIGRLKNRIELNNSISSDGDECVTQFYVETNVDYQKKVIQCIATNEVAMSLYQNTGANDILEVFGTPTDYELKRNSQSDADIRLKVDTFKVIEIPQY